MSLLTLAVNSSRSLYVDRFGNLATSTDENAMEEFLTQRLSSLTGEFRFDKQRGISYMTTVYSGGKESIPALRANIISALTASQEVIAVSSLALAKKEDDNLAFELSVATTYGQIYLRV